MNRATDPWPYHCASCISSGAILVFDDWGAMMRHMTSVHIRDKAPHRCPRCQYVFGAVGDFQRHICSDGGAAAAASAPLAERASGRAEHDCTLCDARFGTRADHRAHMRAEHERRKQFSCEHCGKVFGWRQNMQTHVRIIHEGRRDFTCELCGWAFSTKANLRQHRRSVHQGLKRLPTRAARASAAVSREKAH